MKTKQIPALITLFAGFVTCMIAIFEGVDTLRFTKILLAVLIGFYIFGCIVKVILDKNFADEPSKNKEETQGQEATERAESDQEDMRQKEDIRSEGDNEK